jgi:hypothetical protein
MEIAYDILFSIKVKHTRYDENPVPGISLVPTESCRAELARYGMVFKPTTTGGFAGIEVREADNGDFVPVRPWKQIVDFTFLIKTDSSRLFAFTNPYTKGAFNSELSNAFLLYCDNLDTNNAIDQSEELTAHEVLSTRDIFFLTPQTLSFSGLDEVRYTPMYPGGSQVRESPAQRGQSPLNITLLPGAYTFTRLHPSGSKTDPIIAGLIDDTRGLLGVIRIFKDPATDYDSPLHYTLSMQEAT